jgi:hypothetical protein
MRVHDEAANDLRPGTPSASAPRPNPLELAHGAVRDEEAHPFLRHASEQYFTFGQSRSHFFRHVKGRPQQAQSFGGGTGGRTMRGMLAGSTGGRDGFAD